MGRKRRWAATWTIALIVGWNTVALGALSGGDVPAAPTEPAHTAPPAAVEGERKALFDFPRLNLKTEFSLSVGVRRDDFQWSIAAADGHPNILSELTWSGVDSYQVSLSNRSRIGEYIYLRVDMSYATIHDGNVQDSDYAQDDRTAEYSRSISQSTGDHLWDLSLGIGYPFTFRSGNLLLVPLIGGSLHKQSFRISDGYQVVTASGEYPLGPLPSELNSTYRTKWEGIWLGCDLIYEFKPKAAGVPPMRWALSMEYHLNQYRAKADWNLRSDLDHPVSFTQKADGHGINLQAQWSVNLTPDLQFALTMNYLNWSTDHGTDHLNSNIQPQTRRFNGADWESRSFMVGLGYRFF
jgi:hypothetical protein